ncbi:hypothetical protein VNO80_03197 [Phaseolus coccineus]|uniref:Uncharacterized protein n=1 Tax=Phaseolus coccineus TaxID=3886 RepID=A0AAN9RIL9_PHACN
MLKNREPPRNCRRELAYKKKSKQRATGSPLTKQCFSVLRGTPPTHTKRFFFSRNFARPFHFCARGNGVGFSWNSSHHQQEEDYQRGLMSFPQETSSPSSTSVDSSQSSSSSHRSHFRILRLVNLT